MSGGGVSRVSIPKSVNKTIQDIKEIAQNHSDEEIYAMLKECSMDPNETAQKLLLQDTFHEVKRKRDKRKENMNNRETADSRWRPSTQGRGGRGGRGNFPPRHTSHDAGSGWNANAGKENGVNQKPESVVTTASVPATLDADNKGPTPVSSSATGMANESPNAGSSTQSRSYSPEEPAHVSASKLADTPQPPPPLHVEAKSAPSSGLNVTHGKHTPNADQVASPVSVLGVYSSASDPVLVPSLDSRLPAAVGTIKREVRSQRTGVEPHSSVHAESKSAATQDFTKLFQTNKVVPQAVTNSEIPSVNEKAAPEIGNSFGKMPSRYQGFEKNQASESLQPPSSSSHDGSSTSRPSSNYGSRSQQPIGSQKVGPSKEWKPKSTNQSSAPASGTTVTSEVGAIIIEAGADSLPKFDSSVSEESKSNLQHKLEELQLSHSQHVIIPNHLQVPESERTRLSFGFGSFDADFGVKTSYVNEPETDKSPTPLSESSQGVDEASEEPPSSNQNAPPNAREGDYPDNPQSPVNVAKNLSPVEADVPSGAVPEFDQSNKSEAVLPQGASQYSIVHTTPNYNFGLMPTVLGTQFAPFDSSEPQTRDVSRLPSFVVPQYDPSSYYTQLFRPSTDGDGRFSPFLAPGAVTKYNGNVAASSPQSGQPSQENGNSLVLSTAGPTPLVTQAAGVMQSSLAVTQPTVTFFRQPSGVNFPPYHPNYMPPFSQYIPPFYGLPTFHPFLSNTAFPQQNPGNVYQPPAAAASSGVKYPYKPGTNTSNSTHVGTPTGYPQYNSSPTGYSPNPAASTGNSTGNEDLSASQFKENNVYISGQQSEGSTVWIPTPGREVSGLQPNSFYNPSPHAQHVTYAPTQAGHGAYAGMYHPAQTVAAGTPHSLLQQSQTMAGPVEMVGPPGGLYQQPQRAQMNWTGNY